MTIGRIVGVILIIKLIRTFSNHFTIAAFNMRFNYYVVFLLILSSCLPPLIVAPSNTGVYKNHESVLVRWKPVTLEKKIDDTIFVQDYIMMNVRTASHFEGIMYDYLNEDSVMNDFKAVLLNLGLKTHISYEARNEFDAETVFFEEATSNYYKGIEANVQNIRGNDGHLKGKYTLIPVFMFHKRHDGSGFIGHNPVNIFYDVVFFVFIFNDSNELVYKNERSIKATSESIWDREEALAFPIEERVSEAHFEEMITEALRDFFE